MSHVDRVHVASLYLLDSIAFRFETIAIKCKFVEGCLRVGMFWESCSKTVSRDRLIMVIVLKDATNRTKRLEILILVQVVSSM